MNIILYKNTAENIRLDKTNYLTEVLSLEGTLREECSVINPRVLVQLTELPEFNYVYIVEFKRYYFLTNIISYRKDLWLIELNVDVTMSFLEKIKNITALIRRNQFDYNKDIFDNRPPLKNVPTWSVKKLQHSVYFPFTEHIKICVGIVKNSYLGNDIYDTVEDFGMGCIPPSECSPINKTVEVYLWDNIDRFNDFIYQVGADSALASQVVFIRILPIANLLTDTSSGSDRADIKPIESVSLVGKSGDLVSIKTNGYIFNGGANIHDAFEFTIPRQYDDFRDFSPYSEYELYVPLYGWVQLDSTKVLGKKLAVFTSLDVTNGEAQTTVYIGSVVSDPKNPKMGIPSNTSDIVTTVSYTLGSSLPITYNGSADAIRQSEANITRKNGNDFATSLNTLSKIAVFGGTVAALATGGAALPIVATGIISGAVGVGTSHIGNLAVNEANYEANEILNVARGGATGSTSVYNSYHSTYNFYLRKYSYEVLTGLDTYAFFAGRPLNEVRTLKDLEGYTEVGEVFINDFESATHTEIQYIKETLTKGIIL